MVRKQPLRQTRGGGGSDRGRSAQASRATGGPAMARAGRTLQRPASASETHRGRRAVLEAGLHHFLDPRPYSLCTVPLEFDSVAAWAQCIAQNLLAEYWALVKNGRVHGVERSATVLGPKLLALKRGANETAQHLLVIDQRLHLTAVRNPPSGEADSDQISVNPELQASGATAGTSISVRDLGYVGSYISEHAALAALAAGGANPRDGTEKGRVVVRSVLRPSLDFPGDYIENPTAAQRCARVNETQCEVVAGLGNALEKIQGPPGTGKSTTIAHIVESRVKPGARVLITCSRNAAVDALALKLQGKSPELLVFGSRSRVGAAAAQNLLDARYGRHPKVAKARRLRDNLSRSAAELRAELDQRQESVVRAGGRLWTRAWAAFIRNRYMLPALLTAWYALQMNLPAAKLSLVASPPLECTSHQLFWVLERRWILFYNLP